MRDREYSKIYFIFIDPSIYAIRAVDHLSRILHLCLWSNNRFENVGMLEW